jgi:hypothetical protein
MGQKIRRDSMKRTFFVHHIPDFEGWETCFRFLMEKSDTFRIILQGNRDASDADEYLNAGKKEFLDLPSITISPYEGMENSIKVTGELNRVAREIFLTFLAPDEPDLWSFQFLKGNDVMLEVADFTEGWLYLEESEVEDLLAQGIGVDGIDLDDFDSFLAEERQSDVEVVSWSKDDLSSLANQFQTAFADLLQTTFPADHENVPTPPEDGL